MTRSVVTLQIGVCRTRLLGGSWVVIGGVISPPANIFTVTPLITPHITTLNPIEPLKEP